MHLTHLSLVLCSQEVVSRPATQSAMRNARSIDTPPPTAPAEHGTRACRRVRATAQRLTHCHAWGMRVDVGEECGVASRRAATSAAGSAGACGTSTNEILWPSCAMFAASAAGRFEIHVQKIKKFANIIIRLLYFDETGRRNNGKRCVLIE